MRRNAIALLGLAAALAAGCSSPKPLSSRILHNAVYPNDYVERGKVRLKGGSYENSNNHISVELLRIADGDLNGDGVPDAAVLLGSNTGGSAVFEDVVAVLNRKGGPDPRARTFLGDRVRVDTLAIRDGAIYVHMIAHGPSDPMCCPTLAVSKTFAIKGDTLFERP